MYHLLDDYFYQTEVRMDMVADFLPNYNLTYFNLNNEAGVVSRERGDRLIRRYHEMILHSFKGIKLEKSPHSHLGIECLNVEWSYKLIGEGEGHVNNNQKRVSCILSGYRRVTIMWI
ncbi:hypothetical protein CVN76_11105 [Bacillus sp. mrc49]|nr:hypothetical protein CVN76_11105 [Bacillus sp. mrc49]